jgi:hypothetical protein
MTKEDSSTPSVDLEVNAKPIISQTRKFQSNRPGFEDTPTIKINGDDKVTIQELKRQKNDWVASLYALAGRTVPDTVKGRAGMMHKAGELEFDEETNEALFKSEPTNNMKGSLSIVDTSNTGELSLVEEKK